LAAAAFLVGGAFVAAAFVAAAFVAAAFVVALFVVAGVLLVVFFAGVFVVRDGAKVFGPFVK